MKKSTTSSIDSKIFWDTSGFFALLNTEDARHDQATNIFRTVQQQNIQSYTTDWIIGETSTLFVMRGHSKLARRFLELTSVGRALKIIHVDEELFSQAREFFLKRSDSGYSFTDCTSFIAMKRFKLSQVVTADSHFAREGFNALFISK